MKVLFISHDATRTGAPILLLNLIKWLKSKKNVEPLILLRNSGELEPEFRALGTTYLGIEIDRLISDLQSNTVSLIYSNTAVPGDMLAQLCVLNVPVVSHIHELEMAIKRWASGGLFNGVTKYTDHFIAVSNAVKDNLTENFSIPEAKISVVNGCIEDHFFQIEDKNSCSETLKQILKIDLENKKIVGACGTSDWRKGPEYFLLAAKELLSINNDVMFIWIGNSEDSFELEELKYVAKKLKISKNVHFIGRTKEAHKFFAVFDLFWLTSREDPFPLVCLEAAAQKTPIVCFKDAGGMPEFIDNKVGAIVDFADFKSMATRSNEILLNEDKRKAMSEEIRRKVIANHTIAVMGEKIFSVLKRVCRL